MNLFQSLILGIVQGLTEFIPVSSSGHLWLIPKVLGWENPSTSYILFLQLGTLFALIIYYRKLIWDYLKTLIIYIKNRSGIKKEDKVNMKVIINIVLATIPAGVIGVLLDSKIENLYDDKANEKIAVLATVGALIFIGILFIFSSRLFRAKKYELEKLSIKNAIIIGFSQALALIRGTSRSGITLLSGQAVGLKRFSAAEFSFLMSIPILGASSLFGVYNFLKMPQAQIQQELGPAVVGMLAAFVAGLLAINFLLKFLKTNSLVSFGIYRIIFALVILVILFGSL